MAQKLYSATCRTCSAKPGEPCRTRAGREADKAHWGRPHYEDWRRAYPTHSPRHAFRPKPAPYARPAPDLDEVAEYESRRYGD